MPYEISSLYSIKNNYKYKKNNENNLKIKQYITL